MTGDPEPKKQLGKIMLQRKLVTQDELTDMLAEQQREPGNRLASVATRSGVVSMEAALSALSEQHGVPHVDLTLRIVPLSNLKLLPREIAEERSVFPFALEGDALALAMANPGDTDVVEEIGFVVNKKLARHVALDSVIRQAIADAYAAADAGGEHYIGAHVSDADLEAAGLAGATRAAPPPGPAVAKEVAEVTGETPVVAGEPVAGDELFAEPPPVRALSEAPPLDPAFEERPRPSQPPKFAASYGNSKVLVVDASPRARGTLRAAILSVGVPVVEAEDGVTALEKVRDEAPQVLVLDAALPKVHGFDICRRLTASSRFSNIAIIMVSDTYRGWRIAEDLRDVYGVQHFFEKPLDVPRLLDTIRRILDEQPFDEGPPPMSREAEARWNKGMEYFETGDLDRAIEELEAGVKGEAGAFELCYHLGLLYGRRDDLFQAIQMLEDAIVAQPKHFSALKNLAVVYQRAGFRRKAADVWQRAIDAAPDQDTRDNIKDLMLELL